MFTGLNMVVFERENMVNMFWHDMKTTQNTHKHGKTQHNTTQATPQKTSTQTCVCAACASLQIVATASSPDVQPCTSKKPKIQKKLNVQHRKTHPNIAKHDTNTPQDTP